VQGGPTPLEKKAKNRKTDTQSFLFSGGAMGYKKKMKTVPNPKEKTTILLTNEG